MESSTLKFNFVADPSLNLLVSIKTSLYKYLKRMFKLASNNLQDNSDMQGSLIRFRPNRVCDIAKVWL